MLKSFTQHKISLNAIYFLHLRCSFSIWSFSGALMTSKYSTPETEILVWGRHSLCAIHTLCIEEEYQRVTRNNCSQSFKSLKLCSFSILSSFFSEYYTKKSTLKMIQILLLFSRSFSFADFIDTRVGLFFSFFSEKLAEIDSVRWSFTFGCNVYLIENQL